MRYKFPREHYIPKGATKISDKLSSAVAYTYEKAGVSYALAFHGKADKPDWHFRFKDEARRAKSIAEHFTNQQARAKLKETNAAERKEEPHGLEVGDILKSSWGYDQTNIDYYEVTKIIGKRMVEIREIGAESVEAQQWLTGKSVPVPGKYISEPMRKAARKGGVKIASYAWASKMTPKIVAGVKVYEVSNYSSYA